MSETQSGSHNEPERVNMGVSKSDGEDPSRLILPSLTRAADAGHLAAADIAEIAGAIGAEYRLVGGNAVSLLVWHHQVTDLVPARETVDADFGAPHPRLSGHRTCPINSPRVTIGARVGTGSSAPSATPGRRWT